MELEKTALSITPQHLGFASQKLLTQLTHNQLKLIHIDRAKFT